MVAPAAGIAITFVLVALRIRSRLDRKVDSELTAEERRVFMSDTELSDVSIITASANI